MRFANLYPIMQPTTTRRWTAIRAAFLGLLAFGLLAVSGASAATGLIDETTYESPTYGYRVEWDQPWEFFEDGTVSDDGIDSLSLLTYGGVLSINGAVTDVPAEEFARYYAEDAPEAFDAFDVVAQGEDDGVHFVRVEAEMNDKSWVIYTEVREIAADDGGPPLVIAVNLSVTEATFANSAAAAISDVELDGEPALIALDIDDAGDQTASDRDGESQDDDSRERGGDDQDSRHADHLNNDEADKTDEDDDDRNR